MFVNHLKHLNVRKTLLKSQIRSFGKYVVRPPASIPSLDKELLSQPFQKVLLSTYFENQAVWKDRVALVDGSDGRELTFQQMNDLIYEIASGLQDLGITKGDVVALISPNHLNWSPAFIGIMYAGGVSTPVNPLYTEYEISYQLEATKAKVILTHQMNLKVALKLGETYKLPVVTLDNSVDPDYQSTQPNFANVMTLDQLIAKSSKEATKNLSKFDNIKYDAKEDIITLPFSSGTTGRSKGVMLTHMNLTANLLQSYPYEGVYIREDLKENRPRGSVLVPLPLFHIYGMISGMCNSIFNGAKLITMKSFDIVQYLELLQKHKVTRGYVVPPIVLALAKHEIVDKYDLSSLECLICAGKLNSLIDLSVFLCHSFIFLINFYVLMHLFHYLFHLMM